jgi:hypothetical protein
MSLSYISCTSKEYDEVTSLIRSSCPDECIVSIDKFVTPDLVTKYETYKQSLPSYTEATVFHGTSEEAVWRILQTGFDVGKQTRNAHGIGTYFGTTAQVSRAYAKANSQEDNILLICRMALGPKKAVGVHGKPFPQGTDYGVDMAVKPSMYVMPHNGGAIPLYLVRFYAPAADMERKYTHVQGKRA